MEEEAQQKPSFTDELNLLQIEFLNCLFTYMKLVYARIYPLVHKMTVFFVNRTKLTAKEKSPKLLVVKYQKARGVLYTLDSVLTSPSVTSTPNSL